VFFTGVDPNETADNISHDQVIEAADLVGRISTFVSAMSGHEGAELPDAERPAALDAARFLSELRRTLGMPAADPIIDNEDGSSSEGSSFFSDNDDDDEDGDIDGDSADIEGMASAFDKELERQMGIASLPAEYDRSSARVASARVDDQSHPCRGETSFEVDTETDSDDEPSCEAEEEDEDALSLGDDERPPSTGKGGFFGAYSTALEDQLRDTRMAESFDRIPGASDTSSQRRGGTLASDEECGIHLQPVDLDMNLVRSLLKSVSAQQGLAGPGGNLAGMLGIDIPQGLDESNL